MAFKKKTWKDRLVEHAGRRTLKRISGDPNGTMVVDVSRNEGTVSQAGDAFSAANMNDLEQRISDEFTSVNNNLSSCKLITEGSGANTKYYIQMGADTASKKSLGSSGEYKVVLIQSKMASHLADHIRIQITMITYIDDNQIDSKLIFDHHVATSKVDNTITYVFPD